MTDDAPHLGRDPIPGAERAGQPARYTPEFERLEAEITKLSSLTGGDVDWYVVVSDATTVLASRSKDLLAAVYLCRAQYQLEGAVGLERGLGVVRDLLTTFWDDLQPALTRLRARRAALLWLSDGLSPLLEGQPPGKAWAAGLEVAQAIEAFCDPHFADGDSGISGVRRALSQLATAAEAISEPTPARETRMTGTPTASVTRSAPSPALTANSGAIADRAEALRRLQELAEFFQRTEPHGPIGFLVQRAAKWGELSFQQLYLDLLANNTSAQGELWQILGLPRPADGSASA